jgi:hypothetical protein
VATSLRSSAIAPFFFALATGAAQRVPACAGNLALLDPTFAA